MNSPYKYIKGECMEMCPEDEILLRQKERLVHVLEARQRPEKSNILEADRQKMVKSFSRSAVGKHMQNPKNLRPPEILLKTVNYLLEKVIVNKQVPWNVVYDFIMDRLRSVRQDMIIQNVSVAESICILQPIVKFYAYASYRLCNETIENFDPYINQTHLQECLKRLLCLYDECDILFNCSNDSYCMNKIKNMRPSFEALYLILNLGNSLALTRALNLSTIWRNGVVNVALNLSLHYYKNNFVKVCRLIKTLPVLLKGVAAVHLPEIRRQSFKIMSVAYSSKNLTFPLEVIEEWFLYDNLEHILTDCNHYGLKCRESGVHFSKADFDNTVAAVQPTHVKFIDEEFEKIKISDLILNECAAKKHCEAKRTLGNQSTPLLTSQHQNIGGVLVSAAGPAFPSANKEPQILRKSDLSTTHSSAAPALFPDSGVEFNDQAALDATALNTSTTKDYSYFATDAVRDPRVSGSKAVTGPSYFANQRTRAGIKTMSEAEAETSKAQNATHKMKLSQSGILYALHIIREPVVDYQESRGVPRNEDITFLTLVTSLCTQAYTAAITILVMLWNLMPLVDGLVYFVRFLLDKTIDIVQTDDNKERAIKAAILFGELTIITFIIFMIVGLIFMPVYMLMARLFSKIFSMIAW